MLSVHVVRNVSDEQLMIPVDLRGMRCRTLLPWSTTEMTRGIAASHRVKAMLANHSLEIIGKSDLMPATDAADLEEEEPMPPAVPPEPATDGNDPVARPQSATTPKRSKTRRKHRKTRGGLPAQALKRWAAGATAAPPMPIGDSPQHQPGNQRDDELGFEGREGQNDSRGNTAPGG